MSDPALTGERRTNASLLSTCLSGVFPVASWAGRRRGCDARRRLVVGSGVAFPKSRRSGCEAGHADLFRCPRLPSRTRVRACVGDEPVVERVADPSLERSDGFLIRFAFGEFAFVVGAAR
jgi:hypothetical protein